MVAVPPDPSRPAAPAARDAAAPGSLADYAWVRGMLDAGSAALLAAGAALAGADRVTGWVLEAVRLSAAVLDADPAQLPGQLWGRLAPTDAPEIAALLAGATAAGADARPPTPWLRPLAPCLTPPNGPLLRTVQGPSAGVGQVAVTADGRWAAGASGQTVRVIIQHQYACQGGCLLLPACGAPDEACVRSV